MFLVLRASRSFRPSVTACFVTGRRRLELSIEGLLGLVGDAVRAGVDLIQVRERDLEANVLARLVSDVMAIAHGSNTKVVVNDRLDVAVACGADGVHLRADSIGVAAARRLAPPGFVVGRSVHAADEARVASREGADYLIAGTLMRPLPSQTPTDGWAMRVCARS